MFGFLKRLCQRQAQARHYAGYDWAMSELAKGNYDYVESWAYDRFNDNEFNAGARQAIDDWDTWRSD